MKVYDLRDMFCGGGGGGGGQVPDTIGRPGGLSTQMISVEVLMQLSAELDLTVHQLDVRRAYLNAPIDCEIY